MAGAGKGYKACGYTEYWLERLEIAANKWAEWQLRQTAESHELACAKHPRAANITGAMKAALADLKLPRGAVVVTEGRVTTDQPGLRILSVSGDPPLREGHCAHHERVRRHRRTPRVRGLAVEIALTYNRLAFLIGRAEAHRQAGHADRCKHMYDEARSTARRARRTRSVARRSQISTRNDGVMSASEMTAKLHAMKKQAEDRAIGAYCSKR